MKVLHHRDLATGAVAYKTTPLITPAEVDQAAKKKVSCKLPGS